MIRASDLTAAAAWARPASSPSPTARADLHNPSTWFDGDTGDLGIKGDVAPEARGLSVQQHAGRVLSFLCGDKDAA